MATHPTHVIAGVISDPQGRVLVQRRGRDVHQAGLWEFPGGKVLPGESREQALHRELREELGIRVQQARPLIQITHAYPELTVFLEVWRVSGYQGEPRPLEQQPLRWVTPEELQGLAMPRADRTLVNAVRLPEVCLITGDAPADAAAFLRRLEGRLHAGVRLVQLRVRRDRGPLERLTRKAAALCEAYGAWLVLNGEPEQAQAWGAHGVHLNRHRLPQYAQRPVPADFWLSAVCHDKTELARAAALDADFLLVSPVRPTASHPKARVLGFNGLRSLAAQANRPVFALGGMRAGDLHAAWQVGAQGVAGITAFW